VHGLGSLVCRKLSPAHGVNVTFEGPEEIPKLLHGLELALFRVMQEALTNIHKHSRVTSANVKVALSDDSIALRVKDNGIGIPSEKLQKFQTEGAGMGIGIVGMKQRVRERGGTFSVDSDSLGTTVSVRFLLAAMLERGAYPRSGMNREAL
jgi:signal transduction histidine kinase